jgi:3D (Asp-Asp-Asp) domain-containing protein
VFGKLRRMDRRRLGLFRVIAIVVGFGCLVHLTHRECAKNADRPPRATRISSWSVTEKDLLKAPPKTAKGEVFHATAYSLTGMTRAGVPAGPGYVAADPKVIPLGSVIYVESPHVKGVFQVMDTGDLIKGKIIDIFLPSYEACVDFGRKIVNVKVLRYGFSNAPAEQPKDAAHKN